MTEASNSVPTEYEGHAPSGKDWQDIVAWVGDLPPLPHVASRAISMLENPDVTSGDLTELLSSDPALAARVLKIANSAMFARQRQITTINQAIMVIGFKTLKGIVVAATLRQLNKKYGKLEQIIWENSLCTAMAANKIASTLRKSYVDEVFLLGLLHDLGKVVLVNHTPDEYLQIAEMTKQGVVFYEAEEKVLGYSHPLIGALVAKKWNFSAQASQVILHHHDPIEQPLQGDQDEKIAVIQAANGIAHKLGYGHLEGYPDQTDFVIQVLELLGLDAETTSALIENVGQLYTEQSAAFNS
jgi:HD-like signal output (HDOD) protein